MRFNPLLAADLMYSYSRAGSLTATRRQRQSVIKHLGTQNVGAADGTVYPQKSSMFNIKSSFHSGIQGGGSACSKDRGGGAEWSSIATSS
ncbi:Uu.00g089740.m01.CDS01 [Anthostomella pinea]|uniref:Uu.00g089740.m01.CDS01 n=1 Tax=Anthostomella pinea TaxID=933095 RepID=A0AAI8YKC3_9PEZI|nr:Uu.00g089740.m01.CDS01 [Anthostomella pinea]